MIALAGLAMGLFVSAYYFKGWAPPWLQGVFGLHVSGSGAGQAGGRNNADEARYLGSIILSPRRGDKCWERGLDNRNGAMWDKGPVDCDVVPPLKTLQEEAKGLAARRLNAIGRSFSRSE